MTFTVEYMQFPIKNSDFEMHGICSDCKHCGDVNGMCRYCKGQSYFESKLSKPVNTGNEVFDDLESIKDDMRKFMEKCNNRSSVMDLEDFSNIMETVRSSFHKLYKILDVVPSSALEDLYDVLFDVILNLLEIHFDDNDYWISYWVFDLDFGKKYKKGKVVVNEREIKLESIEDLYKVLT
jgi:hypothetical protein